MSVIDESFDDVLLDLRGHLVRVFTQVGVFVGFLVRVRRKFIVIVAFKRRRIFIRIRKIIAVEPHHHHRHHHDDGHHHHHHHRRHRHCGCDDD